jgi:hypothetical protein
MVLMDSPLSVAKKDLLALGCRKTTSGFESGLCQIKTTNVASL